MLYRAMTETASGKGASPPPIIPAERTGTVTPSPDSRRTSNAAAIGDRQRFAVHNMTMPDESVLLILADASVMRRMRSFLLMEKHPRLRLSAAYDAVVHKGEFYRGRAWRTLISCNA